MFILTLLAFTAMALLKNVLLTIVVLNIHPTKMLWIIGTIVVENISTVLEYLRSMTCCCINKLNNLIQKYEIL